MQRYRVILTTGDGRQTSATLTCGGWLDDAVWLEEIEDLTLGAHTNLWQVD